MSLYRKMARAFSTPITIEKKKESGLKRDRKSVPFAVDNAVIGGLCLTDFGAVNGKGERVGSVQLVKHPEDFPSRGYWLFGLSVKFFYRRMGIGERLTLAVIEQARQEEAQELHLLVATDNREAIRLYRKLGFCWDAIPALREHLQKEAELSGYPRVVMSLRL